ncbi:hypothetical protein LNQ52_32045 [Klebsiella pneumoniae subsp. pneumoniae]|nr:hypothetical protein [Klebsiella pneumoniae subsp. pneumoniae]
MKTDALAISDTNNHPKKPRENNEKRRNINTLFYYHFDLKPPKIARDNLNTG